MFTPDNCSHDEVERAELNNALYRLLSDVPGLSEDAIMERHRDYMACLRDVWKPGATADELFSAVSLKLRLGRSP